MSRVNIIFFCVLSLWASTSYADVRCNVLGNSCPGYLSPQSNEYCCSEDDGDEYCCDASEFFRTKGASVVLPIVLGVLSLVVIFVCCLCCACCSCCPCYRKRERGAVYAVPGPNTTVHVTQSPPQITVPIYGNNPYPQPVYPTQPDVSQPQSPPAYTKQAPYNPDYPNP